jgi:hypothetical protein
MFGQATPVLVNEDTIYARSPYPSALFFWRTAYTPVALPQFILRTPPPPAFLFQDPFVSVYPVLEAYDQVATPQPNAPAVMRFPPAYRPPIVEDEYQRTDQQLLFKIVRTYTFTLQPVGYTVELPDLCDEPWQEWVHPKAPDQSALYPFRQVYVSIRGQQFNLFFNQPPSPRLDPEPDTIRPFNSGVMALRESLAVPGIFTTCGQLDAYDYGNGSILLAWRNFPSNPPGLLPDSYNVYVNNTLNQNVPNPNMLLAVITGLTATMTYRFFVRAVSAGVEVAESDILITDQPTSTMLVTPMKRILPFGNMPLN